MMTASSFTSCFSAAGSTSVTLGIGGSVKKEIVEGEQYQISVTVDSTSVNFSSFVVQAHAESYDLTLVNDSKDCSLSRECVTNGG